MWKLVVAAVVAVAAVVDDDVVVAAVAAFAAVAAVASVASVAAVAAGVASGVPGVAVVPIDPSLLCSSLSDSTVCIFCCFAFLSAVVEVNADFVYAIADGAVDDAVVVWDAFAVAVFCHVDHLFPLSRIAVFRYVATSFCSKSCADFQLAWLSLQRIM